MRPIHRPGALVIACLLTVVLGCRRDETAGELQSLAGEVGAELPQPAAAPAAGAASGGGGADLDGFPLVGSPFPGLGGRLHSSLCDPGSDPYSTCI